MTRQTSDFSVDAWSIRYVPDIAVWSDHLDLRAIHQHLESLRAGRAHTQKDRRLLDLARERVRQQPCSNDAQTSALRRVGMKSRATRPPDRQSGVSDRSSSASTHAIIAAPNAGPLPQPRRAEPQAMTVIGPPVSTTAWNVADAPGVDTSTTARRTGCGLVDVSSSFATSSNGLSHGQNSPEHDDARFATVGSMKTGADRYFDRRGSDRKYAEAYTAARCEIERLDRRRVRRPSGRRAVTDDS